MTTNLHIITLKRTDGKAIKFQEIKKQSAFIVNLLIPIININVSNDLNEAWIIIDKKHSRALLKLLHTLTFFNNYNIEEKTISTSRLDAYNCDFSMN